MDIEFDPEKSARNAAERNLPFALALKLDWDRALVAVDRRTDYGEERLVAVVPRGETLYVVCYVIRGSTRRIISFRKANAREKKAMAKRPLTNKDGDVRELTVDDLVDFSPIPSVDPDMVETVGRSRGRPPAARPKMHIGFRLDADVVDGIRATGRGYNRRIEALLRDALAKGKLRA